MAEKPYTMMRQIRVVQIDRPQMEWRYEAELSDIPNVSAQREQLTILTHVPAPLPAGEKGLHLAALRRVRDLLTAQIEAMQSE